MTNPKVFVGTMYSGENELSRCISAIHEQVGVEITHHIVKNKREIDAHRDLYSTWNNAKKNFDMFVQVDADTILATETMLARAFVELKLVKESGYTSLQYPLIDMLTDCNIMGLNCYSTDVVFNVPNDEVYCDRSTSNNRTHLLKITGGYHSPDPTYQQAFHFGLHRGLKNQSNRWAPQILSSWRKNGDDRRLIALLGFQMSSNFITHKKTSYTDIEFIDAYIDACNNLHNFRNSLK